MTQHNVFSPPQSLRDYGFDVNHHPLVEERSPSGYLLSWDALDAEAEAVSLREPCRYLVLGEYVRDDGVRFPELGVNPAWMRHHGYVRIGRTDWHLPSALCDKERHVHAEPPMRVRA